MSDLYRIDLTRGMLAKVEPKFTITVRWVTRFDGPHPAVRSLCIDVDGEIATDIEPGRYAVVRLEDNDE